MSCNHCGRDAVPNQAEINRNVLLSLRKGVEADRAALEAVFPTPPPGEVRQYVIVAEMNLDGEMVRKAIATIVRGPGIPPDYTPDNIETVHIPDMVLKVEAKKMDQKSDKETSILESTVRFRDVPDIEIGVPSLLKWLGMNLGDFVHLRFIKSILEFDNLQCFTDWAKARLHELSDSDSDAGNTHSARSSCSWATISMDESSDDESTLGSIRSSSSRSSRIFIPINENPDCICAGGSFCMCGVPRAETEAVLDLDRLYARLTEAAPSKE